MATWAVGDVQGCDVTLGLLLEHAGFDARRDQLWLVGDLVNRGPHSLAVLRRVKALGSAATCVLGNHDLKLLALAEGVATSGRLDTLDGVLAAPDRAELLEWLAARPLLVRAGGRVLVHAGLLPGWTVGEAERRAREAEAWLQGPRRRELLAATRQRGASPGADADTRRVVETVRVLTGVRMVDAAGRAALAFSGAPAEAPAGLVPWFDAPSRRSAEATFVFGHWSALGLHLGERLAGLDTGCVWGRCLTALRLDDGSVLQEPVADAPLP